MGTHSKYPVVVPGRGQMDNMSAAGYMGIAPICEEVPDFEDSPGEIAPHTDGQ